MSVNGYKVKVGKDNLREKSSYRYEEGITSSFNIPAIIEDLKNDKTWLEGELNSVILLNSPTVKVLLTILHEGTEVISYQANDSITFQIVEGSLILILKKILLFLIRANCLLLKKKSSTVSILSRRLHF